MGVRYGEGWWRVTYLVGCAASQATEHALCGARGLVNVALEGGGLVFVVGRHGVCALEVLIEEEDVRL